MRILVATVSCVFMLIACNNKKANEKINTVQEDTILEDADLLPPEERLSWKLSYDSLTGNFKMEQQLPLDETATAQKIIADINILWPNVQAVYQQTSGDTVFISIPDSEYLTQRMGSSGPPGYMALVTYTLTDLPGIRFVKFSFEEGDHASPGTYSKDGFKSID